MTSSLLERSEGFRCSSLGFISYSFFSFLFFPVALPQTGDVLFDFISKVSLRESVCR